MSETQNAGLNPTTIFAVVIAVLVIGVFSKYALFKTETKQQKQKKDKGKEKMASEKISKKAEDAPVFLDRSKQTAPLIKKTEVSHDTRIFRFGLPTEHTILGLPLGKHVKITCPNPKASKQGEWNGREDKEADKPEIQRSYTPISSDDQRGHFDLLVKVYKGGVKERFTDGGKMSQYLESLNVGDKVNLQGPFGLVEYKGRGQFEYSRKPLIKKKFVGMIAGGTGVTPMLQIINAVLNDPQDETILSLLFANQTEDDILLREELEKLQKEHPDRFKLWFTVDAADDNWKYSKGFVNEEMIKNHLPASGDDTLILMCGPPPMITYACEPNLTKLGFDIKKDCLSF